MIVTVCTRGNVRSVTAATILKDYYGFINIFPIGMDTCSPDFIFSLNELFHPEFWVVADRNVMKNLVELSERSPMSNWDIKFVDIGIDRWQSPMHPELVSLILNNFQAHGLKPQSETYPNPEIYKTANLEAYYRHRKPVV